MNIEDSFEFWVTGEIQMLKKEVNELKSRLDNLTNSDKVLSAVANKLIEKGIIK